MSNKVKWRLVITGEGPIKSDPPLETDADKSAGAVVDLLRQVEGQTITAATFQVDANNINLLAKAKKEDKAAAPSAPAVPPVPTTV